MRLATSLTAFLLLTAFLSFAQGQKVTQGVEWFGTSSAVKFTPKFGVYFDGQYRFAQSMDNMQHQFRFALDWYVNPKLTISPVGYVFIWNYLYGLQPASYKNNEHRIYQQLQYKHSLGKFAFTHRFRTEERFIQTHTGSAPTIEDLGYDENFQFRIRHRIWANMAFKGQKVEAKSWYWPSFVEAFMSWGDPAYYTYENKIDQFRLFTGIGYQFNKSGNVQIGPFYQYLVKAKGDKHEDNIGFYLQLNYNFDFSKPAVAN
jgi:hypothetical protein